MFGEGGPSLSELLRQALSSTTEGYDQLARKFDRTPFRTPDVVIDTALASVADVNDALDLCCGTGAALTALAARTRGRLVGVDASAGMLAVAREALGPSMSGAAPRIELVHADVRELQLDAAFDLVTCFGAFGHLVGDDEARLVEVVRRALRPGGRFVFVTAERPSPLDPRALAARAFNAVMHVRNAVVSPPFVMYYLTFLLPDVARLLRFHGFDVAVLPTHFPAPFGALRHVVATRR